MTNAKQPPAHGSNARSRTCSCPPCYTRRCRYKKAWRTAKYLGQTAELVDFTPALNHIRNNLLPAAWTTRQIEYAAGLTHDYVPILLKDKPPRVYAGTAAAILALGPDNRFRNLPDGARLDPTGTRRRLQALAVKGHRLHDLFRELHCNNGVMNASFVLAGNVRRIAEAYDRLWKVEGPSTVSAARARKRGWVGPGAWDDATIDDPRAVPNVGRDRRWSATELLAEAAVAAISNDDDALIAARVGTTVTNLRHARERVKARHREAGVAA